MIYIKNKTKMRHLDLFSGVGGFSYAIDQVWDNVEHIFCDNNKFCCEVIKKNFGKESLIYGDVRTITRQQVIADTANNGRNRYDQKSGVEGQFAENQEQSGSGRSGGVAGCDSEFAGDRIVADPGSEEQRGLSGSQRQAVPDDGQGDFNDGQIREDSPSIPDGGINRGLGGVLSNQSSSNVEDIDKKEMSVQDKSSVREEQLFLSGDKSIGQSAEYIGTGDRGRSNTAKNDLRDMRGIGGVQGWENEDTVASPRLRETIGSDMALPKMSSPMAQKQSSDCPGGGDDNGICRDSDKRVSTFEGIDLLTGGFP